MRCVGTAIVERHGVCARRPLRVQRRSHGLIPCSCARTRSRVVLLTRAGLAVVVTAERVARAGRHRRGRHSRIIRRRHTRGTGGRGRRAACRVRARVQLAVERDCVGIGRPLAGEDIACRCVGRGQRCGAGIDRAAARDRPAAPRPAGHIRHRAERKGHARAGCDCVGVGILRLRSRRGRRRCAVAAVIVGRRDLTAVLAVVRAAGREGCRRGRRRARAGRPACRCPTRVRALRRRGHCGRCGSAAVVDVARHGARLLRRAAVVNERRIESLAPDGVECDCAAVFAQLIEPAVDVAGGRDLAARCPRCTLRRTARRPAEELPAAGNACRRSACIRVGAVGDIRVARLCRCDTVHIVGNLACIDRPLHVQINRCAVRAAECRIHRVRIRLVCNVRRGRIAANHPLIKVVTGLAERIRRQSGAVAVCDRLIAHRAACAAVAVEGYGVRMRRPLAGEDIARRRCVRGQRRAAGIHSAAARDRPAVKCPAGHVLHRAERKGHA